MKTALLSTVLASSLALDAASLEEQVLRSKDSPPYAATVQFSYRDSVNKARDSVVTIWVRLWKPRNQWIDESYDLMPRGVASPPGNGSGIVLTHEGLILTNHHVVNGAQEIMIRSRGSLNDIPAEIIGMDSSTDVALLRAKSGQWKPATLADSNQTAPGDVVLALGSPFGLEQTITMGIISATGRSEIRGLASSVQDFIQTDAAINPGNSGGALVDGMGRVIGMNTARFGGEGIGLAVPVNLALKVADGLLEYGRVQRGYLGAKLVDVSQEVIAELRLGSAIKGAVITQVEEGYPAAISGLLPGDVITAVNELPVTSAARFLMRMTTFAAGDKVVLAYTRSGQEKQAEVLLKAAPGNEPAPAKPEFELLPGLRVVEIDEKLRNKLLLPASFHGLQVLSDYKLADGTLKVAAGDIILKINNSGISRHLNETDEAFTKRIKPRKPVILLRIKHPSGEETDRGFAVPQQ